MLNMVEPIKLMQIITTLLKQELIHKAL